MRLTFYGVRGSIPTPGAAYVRYGGNTACVHIELEDGTDIILDSGTGIRLLGDHLVKKTTPIHLLLSHQPLGSHSRLSLFRAYLPRVTGNKHLPRPYPAQRARSNFKTNGRVIISRSEKCVKVFHKPY